LIKHNKSHILYVYLSLCIDINSFALHALLVVYRLASITKRTSVGKWRTNSSKSCQKLPKEEKRKKHNSQELSLIYCEINAKGWKETTKTWIGYYYYCV